MKNPHAKALGQLGGKANTEAQNTARAKNGLKGGRPNDFVIPGFCRPLVRQTEAPETSGVYALLFRGKVVYVGCSKNIQLRLKNHSWINYTHYVYRRVCCGEMHSVEKKNLIKYKPKNNCWKWYFDAYAPTVLKGLSKKARK